MKYKIAVIPPKNRLDYLTSTVIDGLNELRKQDKVDFLIADSKNRNEFISYAKQADIITFSWGKGDTDYELAQNIDCFNKTIFIDGSELGRNRRLDNKIVKELNENTWEGQGKIEKDLLKKCAGYFRREKPYIDGIIPFPFGIEKKYINWNKDIVKDIDFVCIFGQEQYPPLRKKIKQVLIDFCKKNELSCITERTKDKQEFYNILARAKVGISVSGGGYDTARFWEILGNNCILLTEKIDIYRPEDKKLEYNNIFEFIDEKDFEDLLNRITLYLRSDYNTQGMVQEYNEILKNHSTVARVNEIIDYCKYRGIIK
jgi:REP element-mobilizing transposase RayT